MLEHVRGRAGRVPERPLYATVSAFGNWSECVVRGDRKFVRVFDPETGQVRARRVFDLENDPRETRSVPYPLDGFQSVLAEASSDHGYSFDATVEDVGPALRSQLQALGYME